MLARFLLIALLSTIAPLAASASTNASAVYDSMFQRAQTHIDRSAAMDKDRIAFMDGTSADIDAANGATIAELKSDDDSHFFTPS